MIFVNSVRVKLGIDLLGSMKVFRENSISVCDRNALSRKLM